MAASAGGRKLGWTVGFPWRRIILTLAAIGIGVFVLIGSYRTLTLPDAERIIAETWFQLMVRGLALGAVYALIALGYTLVYGILRTINFAHGEVFMAGAFGSYFFAAAFAESGFLDRHIVVSVIVLLLSSMAVSVGVAVLLERVAYRPVRRAPRVVPLITAIGASLFLQGTFSGFFGPDFKGYPKPEILGGQWELFGVTVKRTDIVVFLTMVVAVAALQYFVRRTTTGKSMRAVAYDREIASLMGIDVDRVVLTTFAIGGLLAGIAAVLYSMTFGQIGPFMGFLPGIAAFTAAVLGGIGSIGGAALGGLLLGILQSVGPYLLLSGFHVPSPFQLKDVVTFSVLVLVLLFRPAGLLGSEEVDRL